MRFCRACGASLATAPSVVPFGAPSGALVTTPGTGSRGGAPSPVTITCPRCGTSTPNGFAFCQQCGFQVQAASPPTAQPLPPPPSLPTAQPLPPPPSLPTAPPLPPAPTAPPIAEARARPPSRPGLMRSGEAPSATLGPQVGRSAVTPGAAWGEAVLVNRDGSDGQRFALASEDVMIGRAGADIAFDEDRFLARQHARVSRAGGEIRIHAIDTINGVFKKADGPVELADGATLLVGREVLRFERVAPDERAVHPLVRHGVALFGSPPREPWGRVLQLIPSGGYRDVRHLAGDEVVLGREEGDLVFRDDAFMSRRHAAITWNGQRAQLVDLGSSNGTFVRIAGPTPLKQGDHVRVGDQLLRIELR
jgi:hypothetical protein